MERASDGHCPELHQQCFAQFLFLPVSRITSLVIRAVFVLVSLLVAFGLPRLPSSAMTQFKKSAFRDMRFFSISAADIIIMVVDMFFACFIIVVKCVCVASVE